ncbi:DNA cytosine methyltransferase [Ezakiella coagulans]|uniref:DNA cytosine methyltransferase n=1 Tax=Ezakiella coagulans TaxID=46507 RepID=UPI002014FEB2|nr:DNA cytosine methyltransferase [Ezakiella coagulans]UQK60765.1 DNA cytosine methyltransferase [Ezakiella coagulans]
MYRAIDLFAGIGGIRLGFEQAFQDNIETLFVSEWDEKATETYKANFGNEIEINGDITKIKEEDIPEHDILLAGFPCQAFSMAGQRKGFNDTRGTLFFDVARIIKYHKPKVVFCENVKNLLNHDRGRTFKVIKNVLEELGYIVYYKVLNSKNFGVPQNRERIYIVAFRKDINHGFFNFPEETDSTKTIRDIMEDKEVSPKYYLSTVYLESLRRHKQRHESKGNGFGYEIRDIDSIAGAIVCGGMGRERNLIIDNRLTDFVPVTHIKGDINREFIRKMTPREWARLQGFPDDYKMVVADTHLYKQFGNSVTVPVIRAIAENIKKYITDANIDELSDIKVIGGKYEQMSIAWR